MSSNGNRQWTLWLAGVLFAILSSLMLGLVNHVIANEKESVLRDTTLETKCVARYEDICGELNRSCKEQSQTNQKIMVTMARIESYLDYRKKNER